MLKSIELKNFQVHSHTKLELVSGLNVITGYSDEGKSSIIRALYWLVNNKPSGNEFISWDSKKCSVTIKTNKHTVTREKRGSINKYIVNDIELNATRSTVPEEVKEALNITDMNIQLQDDPYFMLSLNPGDVAKKLNEIVGLHQIAPSVKYVNSLIRSAKSKKEHLKKDIDSINKELERYSAVEDIEKLNKQLEKYEEQQNNYSNNLEELEYLIQILSDRKDIEKKEKETKKLLSLIEKYLQWQSTYVENKSQLQKVISLIHIINNLSKNIQHKNKKQKKLDSLCKSLEADTNEYDEQINLIYNCNKIISSLKELSSNFDKISKDIKSSEEEFENYKAEIEVCPLCEKPF